MIEVMTHASQRNPLGSKFVKYVRCSTAKHLLDKFFGPLNFILLFIKKFSFQERHACFVGFLWDHGSSLACLSFKVQQPILPPS